MKKYVKTSFFAVILLFLILMIICFLISFISLRNQQEVSNNGNDIIYIDPGHGGKDNGTSYEDIYEDELNMKLASSLYENLLNKEYVCYLSRVNDYDLSSAYAKNHKIDDLKKRIEYMERINASLFVSLHLNYYPSSKVNGLQVFYQKGNEKSIIFAKIMQEKINELNTKTKKIKIGDYYLLNNTSTPGILIEYGFMSSEYDRNRLNDPRYFQKLVHTISDGIEEYLYHPL